MGIDFYKQLLKNNKDWAKEKLNQDPRFFKRLEERHNPTVLWIGCSDSRVPANELMGAQPGEVFVHRNIANMVIHSDMNMLSVLDYAVNILKVTDVIVCGHYDCGGLKAAMEHNSYGIIDNWIRHIKDVYRFHKDELDSIEDDKKRLDKFIEINVKEQVYDLAKTSIVQAAWKRKQELHLHGWVYRVGSGIVKDLNVNIRNNDDLDDVYQLNF